MKKQPKPPPAGLPTERRRQVEDNRRERAETKRAEIERNWSVLIEVTRRWSQAP